MLSAAAFLSVPRPCCEHPGDRKLGALAGGWSSDPDRVLGDRVPREVTGIPAAHRGSHRFAFPTFPASAEYEFLGFCFLTNLEE
jgi:hypothetical protein